MPIRPLPARPGSHPRNRRTRLRNRFFRPLRIERFEDRALLTGSPIEIQIQANGLREGLDLDWGVEGRVQAEFPPGTGALSQMRAGYLTPDGLIVAAGFGQAINEDGTAVDGIALAQFNAADGSSDGGFGVVTAPYPNPHPEIADSTVSGEGIVFQPDGKILLVGSAFWNGNDGDAVVVRYNSDGSLDTDFGDGGYVSIDLPGTEEELVSAAVSDDGRIVVIGNQDGESTLLARFLENGELDEDFGDGGIALIEARYASTVLLQADGILVGGAPSQNLESFWVARYDLTGAPDLSFGENGEVFTTFFGDGFTTIIDVALTSDGQIVAAGAAFDASQNDPYAYDIAVAKYNADGSPDLNFGTGGIVTTDLAGFDDSANAVLVQPDGKIVVGTSVRQEFLGPYDQALIRYLPDGTLDPLFGEAGKQYIDYGAQEDVFDLLLQPDGRIVAVGNSYGDATTVAISRFGGTFSGYVDDFTTLTASITDSQGTSWTYDWQLYRVPNELIDSGSSSTVYFTPDTEGLYGLDLMVTNDLGDVKQNTVYVNVMIADHNLSPKNLQVAFSMSSVEEGDAATISGSFQDANPDDSHHVTIDWGDGTTTEFDLAAGVTSFVSQGHAYQDNPTAGTSYSATVVVSDQDGLSVNKTAEVSVTNVAPSPHLGSALQAIDDVTFASGTISRSGRFAVIQGFSDPAAYTSPIRPYQDIFVKDLQTGSLTLVSCDENGVAAHGHSLGGTISDDGRYVAFASTASNWIDFGGVFATRIYVKDLQTGALTLVSSGENGPADGVASPAPEISADGRIVAFVSTATNLVSDQTFGNPQVYVKDLETGVVTLASTAGLGEGGDSPIDWGAPSLSADGHYVAFASMASNLVSGDTNDVPDVFVKDLWTGAITLVSSDSAGNPGDNYSYTPSISADGRYIAFASDSSNLLTGQTVSGSHVYVKDLQTGEVILASAGSAGPGDSYSYASALSANGRYVAFVSAATNLVAGDDNGLTDIFIKDLLTGDITLVSAGGVGSSDGDSYIPDNSVGHSVSNDGRFVLFLSAATNLIDGLTGPEHLFLRDLQGSTLVDAAIEGQAVHLQASASDPSAADSASGFSFSWSVAKNGVPGFASGSGANIDFTPNDNGVYVVTVIATDKDGDSGTTTASITVANAAPTAAISGAPASSPEGTPLSLTSASTDPSSIDQAALTYAWSITKDGSPFGEPGTGAGYTFTPDDNASYVVSLVATDKDGASHATSATIAVTNADPHAVISGAPATSPEGTAISLSSDSTDPSSVDQASLTFAWSVTKNGVNYSSGSGSGFSFTPDDNGTYVVTLTVTDKDGGVDSTTRAVTVNNAAPTPIISGAPATSQEGTTLNLSSASTDLSSVDQASLNLAWSVTKNGVNYASGSGSGFSFTPNDNGSYVLTLTATDKDGAVDSTTQTVTVNNAAPAAIIDGAPATSPEGTTINLTGSATDPGSADQAAGFTFAWSVTKNGVSYGSGSGSNLSFTPDDNGAYIVSLTATDKDLASHTATATITATNVAPTATVIPPLVVNEGVPVAVSLINPQDASPADAAAGFRYAFAWDGDENSLPTTYAAALTSNTRQYTFPDSGTFTVKVRVFDRDDAFTTYSLVATMNNVAPTATFNAPILVQQGADAVLSFSATNDSSSADRAAGLRYSFAFDGNDASLATSYLSASPFPKATSSFGSPGTYTVKGRVFDKDGGFNTYVAQILVVRTNQFGTSSSDVVQAIATDSTGIYVAGYTGGNLSGSFAGVDDVFVRKYSASGVLQWTSQFGTGGSDIAYGIATDSTGVYVTGITDGSLNGTNAGGYDVFVRKYSTSGAVQWTTQFGTVGSDFAYSIATDSTGVYVTGYTWGNLSGTNAGGQDAFVRKYNTSGTMQWTKQFGTTTTDYAIGIASDSTGVYVAGFTWGNLNGTNAGAPDAFVRKYDSSGIVKWTNQFGTTSSDYLFGIATDSTGVYVAGHTYGSLNGINGGSSDGFLRKYNASGAVQWTNQFGTSTDDFVRGITTDSTGVYVAGYTLGSLTSINAGAQDGFVRKYDTSGAVRWTSQFGTPAEDNVRGIATDLTGVYVAGYTLGSFNGTSAGGYDAFVTKLVVSSAYVGGGGSVINGHLVGATAIFDVNQNGRLDPNEPWGLTDATGQFNVPVPAVYDLNENGLLDDDEGQWVVTGGTDSSTGLPAVNTLIAPASWSVVTPLTTLVSTLAANYALTLEEAAARVTEALGLPPVDLATLDPIAAALAGDSDAAAIFAAHAKLQDTIAQSLAVLDGAGGSPPRDVLSAAFMAEIASQIAAPGAMLNLSDAAVVGLVLRDVADQNAILLDEQIIDGAATVIAATNELVDSIPVTADVAFLTQVAQVKTVSQGAVATQLSDAASGALDIEAVVTQNTGDALAEQLAAVPAASPTLLLPETLFVEATSAAGAVVEFSPTATNLAGDSVPVISSPVSGSLFAMGQSTVHVTATDSSGASAEGSFMVIVQDTTAPFFTPPESIFVEQSAVGGAYVSFTLPVATDAVDSSPQISADFVSGSLFPVGTTIVTVTAVDATGNSQSIPFTITVLDNNHTPTANPDVATVLQDGSVVVNVLANDSAGPDFESDQTLTVTAASALHGTVTINADGTLTYQPVAGYSGPDTISYTITDNGTTNGIADPKSASSTVAVTVNPNVSPDLVIRGTAGNDTIVVAPGSSASTLQVTFNGVSSTVAKPAGRIIIYGGNGDDNVQIAGGVTNQAWLYGEAGNDRLNAGNGGSLLFGGDGNDDLTGGNGRDVIIGGLGADKLNGNGNDDILVGGKTKKDDRLAAGHDAFWAGLLTAWNSANPFDARVLELRSKLLPEVVDDLLADQLNGAAGDDWLVYQASQDKLSGKAEASN